MKKSQFPVFMSFCQPNEEKIKKPTKNRLKTNVDKSQIHTKQKIKKKNLV